ncbi:MAG TPA: hypothetical protein VEP90_14575 [Methylomirabilota bacterium]|nr:hypothetical protein [Methylomirabilota bacterium]
MNSILARYIKLLHRRAEHIKTYSQYEGKQYHALRHENAELHKQIADEIQDLLDGKKTIEELEQEESATEQSIKDILRWQENGGPVHDI